MRTDRSTPPDRRRQRGNNNPIENRRKWEDFEMINRQSRRDALKLLAATALAGAVPASIGPAQAAGNMRIAMAVNALGIGFFHASRDGGPEGARDRANADVSCPRPTA